MCVAQCILLLLLFASNSALADMQLNLTPGVTPISHDIYDLHMTVFWICVVIGIIVFGAMLYSIVHHRKDKGAISAHFHEHLYLELTWTILPLLVLIAMAIPATKVLIHMSDPDEAALTIKVTAHQWKWEYEYMDQGVRFFSNLATPYAQIQNQAPKDKGYLITVDKPLVLPIHKKIRFLVTSGDVIHSWYLPDFAVKTDAVPGFINESWARINRAGTYHGQCAELCGINHGYMPIVVTAMSETDFNNWLAVQKGQALPQAPATPTESKPLTKEIPKTAPVTATTKIPLAELNKKGETIYLNTCAVCHQPTGLGMPPTFTALKTSPFISGPVARHINRVVHGKPGTTMQAFKEQLSDEDIAAVITYERNAWDRNSGEAIQVNQVKEEKTKPAIE
jgi:cytochrome c oxidase subunit 2